MTHKRYSALRTFIFALSKSRLQILSVILATILSLGGFLSTWPVPLANATLTNGENATHILGATTSYTTRSNTTSQSGFYRPRYEAYDSTHKRLFVSDGSNRVKVYDLSGGITDGMNATWLLGQTSWTGAYADEPNAGAGCTTTPNACGLNNPAGLAYDSEHDRLFVADTGNARVLVFDTASITNGEAAAYVLGQTDFASNLMLAPSQQTGGGRSQMYQPYGVYYDSGSERLFVSDYMDHRVLVFNLTGGTITNNMAASYVLGQALFTTDYINMNCGGGSQSGTSAGTQCGFYRPVGVTYDSSTSRLFVSEYGNHRVMVFNLAGGITNGMSASAVLGQPDYTTRSTNTACGGGSSGTVNECSLSYPMGLTYASSPHYLFVADGNNRIMIFDVNSITNGESAVNVVGKTNFTTNAGQLTQNGIYIGYYTWADVAYDSANAQIFVADNYNSRVLTFDASTGPAAPVISNISSGTPSGFGATITWTTDTASSSVVNYGTTASYGSNSSDATLVTSHSRTLSGLTPSTTYHYQVCSTDAGSQTTCSTDRTFITTAGTAPLVDNFAGQGFGEFSTTNFAAVSNMTSVPTMTLSKTNTGSIRWTDNVNVNNADLDSNIRIGTGYVSINVAALDSSLDAPATVKISVNGCTNPQIWYATGFRSTLADIKANGQLCNAGTTPACTNISCSGTTLTFTVPHFDSYGGEGEPQSEGIPTTLNIDSEAPSISSVTDNGSNGTTPTNEGSNITFTISATDANGDAMYIAICKENSITANTNAAPTCGGAGAWFVDSTERSSISGTNVTTSTSGLTAESHDWYAFVCDKVASNPLCSTMMNTDSPFKVNHRPSYSGYSATDSLGGSIEPGENVKFAATTADTDSDTAQDQVQMFVCASGNTFNGTACSGTELCHTTLASPGAASCTTSTTPAPIPTAHGSYNVEIFVVDSHGFAGNGASTQSYAVTDTAPYIVDSGAHSVSDISLTAGDSTAKSYTVTVKDDNGDNDITGVTAVLYDDDAVNLSSGTCPADDNNCVPADAACPLSDVGGGTDNTATATCGFTVWYNANHSANWRAHANPADQASSPTSEPDSGAIATNSLLALNVKESAIAYGAVALGGTSAAQPTRLQNFGNQASDTLVSGTDMSGTPSGTIPAAQQKWHPSDTLDWDSTGYALATSAGVGGEAAGCSNRDLAVRNSHDTSSDQPEDQTLHWKLRIPASQTAGTYAGTNTFASTAGNTCTGTN